MATLRRKEETKTHLVYTAQAELTHGFLSLATLNGGARKVKAETLLALLLKVTEATIAGMAGSHSYRPARG